MTGLDELLQGLEELDKIKQFNRLAQYEPYVPQLAFHKAGAKYSERLFRAGNQLGKTLSGAAEAAMHMTGRYPPWWEGKRYTKATNGWVAGEGAVLTRDGPQKLLCGTPGVDSLFGTGFIPKECFVDRPSMSRGVTDAYDTIQVRHVSGGISTASFKSYDQGRQKFQAATLDWAWCDEEPPADIYSEILARTTATRGMVFITFTPLKGMSTVVMYFLNDPSPQRCDIVMTIYDAKHITPEMYEELIGKYPAHERDARAMGVPMLGSGRIFTYDEETLSEDTLTYVPEHWTKLWSIDFGIGHPFGAVLHAWDRDEDVLHILHAIRMSDALPLQHSAAMRPIAANLPVAWPQDGTERRDDGKPLSDHYARSGLLMLPGHATFPDGSISTEAGLLEMSARMETNRFKVARHLMQGQWGQEYRSYHRDEDGKIVKKGDDLMSATRVGVMAKRFGRPLNLVGDSQLGPKVRRVKPGVAAGVDFNIFR